MRNFVIDRVRNLLPYSPSEVSEGEVKLDAQENPYELPESVRERILERVSKLSLNRYPDPENRNLKEQTASYAGCARENILFGNGSDELIQLILSSCGGSGRLVVAPEPTFSMYKILSDLTGTAYMGIPLYKDFSLPVSEIIHNKPDIIFITYPNNPTGNSFRAEDIDKIIKSSGGLVILDEAYYEFSGKSYIDSIGRYENLIILRTFSKAFSLAGIRAGYLAGAPGLIKELSKAQLPYGFSILNQAILETVLDMKDEALNSVKKLIASREAMFNKLKEIEGITPYESDANFILMKIARISEVLKSLKNNNIKVREFSSPGLRGYLRVTVGTEEENAGFIRAVREVR